MKGVMYDTHMRALEEGPVTALPHCVEVRGEGGHRHGATLHGFVVQRVGGHAL